MSVWKKVIKNLALKSGLMFIKELKDQDSKFLNLHLKKWKNKENNMNKRLKNKKNLHSKKR